MFLLGLLGFTGRTYKGHCFCIFPDNNFFKTITVSVQITANHRGYFEFRICSNGDVNTEVTQACLDENLLPDTDGNIRYLFANRTENIFY